jgi:hypothetical protein
VGNSEESRYSQEFVDGVIRDFMDWKKKNILQQNSKIEAQEGDTGREGTAYLKLNLTQKKKNMGNENNNQRIFRIPVVNPAAAPANNNRQKVAGRELILDRNCEGKQRTLQISNNQNAGNGHIGRINPWGLKSSCDAELPASPIRDVALTCFGEASNNCAGGANEKRAITDSIYNRVRANKSYWGGNTVKGVLSKSGQYLAYDGSQYLKAKNQKKLDDKECQKLKDCISAAQASASGTKNNYTNFNKTDKSSRTPICNHYFWKE